MLAGFTRDFAQGGGNLATCLLLLERKGLTHLTALITDIPDAKGQQIAATQHGINAKSEQAQIVPCLATPQPVKQRAHLLGGKVVARANPPILIPGRFM